MYLLYNPLYYIVHILIFVEIILLFNYMLSCIYYIYKINSNNIIYYTSTLTTLETYISERFYLDFFVYKITTFETIDTRYIILYNKIQHSIL